MEKWYKNRFAKLELVSVYMKRKKNKKKDGWKVIIERVII